MSHPGDTGPHRAPAPSDPVMVEVRLAAVERDVGALVLRVGELAALIGRSPNPATGEAGTGLCGVLTELAEERGGTRRRLVRFGLYGGAGGAGFALLVELVLRLLEVFGGG